MEKFKYLQKIKNIYTNGGNIIQYLRNLNNSGVNTIEDILISYDFQSGSYIKHYEENQGYVKDYCKALAKIIDKIPTIDSLMEVGIGEATTLTTVIKCLEKKPPDLLGFDISWSRLKFANNFLQDHDINNVKLFTANLFEIPLLDSSIDVVYTSHSIEPNGGKEEEALKELYRVTRNYLILLEPSYEFANIEGRERMEKHGYATKIYASAKKLGYKIVEHRRFDHSANPLNPTGLIIIEKKSKVFNNSNLVCPISHSKLDRYNESFLYSNDSYLAYPILENIPCLLKENSILAIHLLSDYENFKLRNAIK